MFSNLSKRIQEKLSNEDNRIFMYNIVGNYCIKGAAIFVSMMMTPVYMSFFYSQKILGVWLTLCQLINYIQLFVCIIYGQITIHTILTKANGEEVINVIQN